MRGKGGSGMRGKREGEMRRKCDVQREEEEGGGTTWGWRWFQLLERSSCKPFLQLGMRG